MRLLFLTPQLPYPPHKGTTIRNYHLLKNLGARHELTLLSFSDGATEADLARLRQHCARVAAVPTPRRSSPARIADLPFPGRPDLVRRLRSPAFLARLRLLLEETAFDLVQIEGLELAWHWTALAHAAQGGDATLRMPPAVLDDHNAEYVLQRRAYEIDRRRPARWRGALYSLLQWQKLVRYERSFCRLMSGVVAASELDRRAILALDKRLNVCVIPNGVDTDYYRPEGRGAEEARLVFAGTMDFRPNVDGIQWFCERIWPSIAAQVPGASFWIVGRDPKPEIVRLADGQRLVVTGAVADVRPHLAAAALTVVPLRIGGGSRLKVLEAMAAGLPVVSTSLGCEGIEVTSDTAVIADDPERFARAVVDLLHDKARRNALAAAGRALVERAYDWSVVVPRVERYYAEVLGA